MNSTSIIIAVQLSSVRVFCFEHAFSLQHLFTIKFTSALWKIILYTSLLGIKRRCF